MSEPSGPPTQFAALPLTERGALTVRVPIETGRQRAWDAYTRPVLRRRWMRLPGLRTAEELELVEGGHERLTSDFASQADRTEHLEYSSHYLEVVLLERIVWSFAVRVQGLLRVASLATVCFTDGEVVHDEQFTVFAATLDDLEAGVAERRGSTRLQLNGFRGVAIADG